LDKTSSLSNSTVQRILHHSLRQAGVKKSTTAQLPWHAGASVSLFFRDHRIEFAAATDCDQRNSQSKRVCVGICLFFAVLPLFKRARKSCTKCSLVGQFLFVVIQSYPSRLQPPHRNAVFGFAPRSGAV